ncbi:amidohydrolase [Radiobacillus kanasensis]|uniref:M20 metallopeptidase family protein n=1 Tax=Radiobacillus kanasensis TaxID=2844358 RepID=UPI001E2B25B9|nr:amidohydrolase [Radiobacillus kanasensis]UFT99182.1 amidohydrolase [Radiobacillus kanasensis]
MLQEANAIKDKLIEWRRHLHQYPELSFQEKNTSTYIVAILEDLEVFHLETGIGGCGVIASIKGNGGPTIGVRADMDALPIQESTSLSFRSKHSGIMHACGHDAHTTMLLGVAHLLATYKKEGRLQGNVKLVFQPAEETADEDGRTGAPHIIESDKLADVEAMIALHVCPWRKIGELQLHSGISMASVDNYRMVIEGKGGHGGYPHQTKDPIWMSSFILQAIYGLISRKVNPLQVGTISVGEIKGGSSTNVIPDKVIITGTIRAYEQEVRHQLREELYEISRMAASLGGSASLEMEIGEPALHNDKKMVQYMKLAAQKLEPSFKIYEEPYGMGGEDFSHYTEKIPGAMAFIGSSPEGYQYDLHTSDFQIDERVLPMGVGFLLETIEQWWKNQ